MSRESASGARVALLGNMNNNFFALARYLRREGYQADLLVGPNEMSHFHPAADSLDLSFREVLRPVPFGDLFALTTTSAQSIREVVAGYDVRFACGTWPAYLAKAGVAPDIFVPYGGDLVDLTRWTLPSPHKVYRAWDFTRYQRRGIGLSRVVQQNRVTRIDDGTVLGEGQWVNEVAIARFAPRAQRWTASVPMVYHPEYDAPLEVLKRRSHWADTFAEIRARHDFVLFNHNRIHFGGVEDHNAKGTDILLEGWAEFRRRRPTLSALLVCAEYGRDVLRARECIERLGLGESVAWLPKMYRRDLMPLLQQSDVICGQFAHSVMSCGTIFEALVAGRPIVGHRLDRLYEADYRLYPMLHAETPETLADRLVEAADTPAAMTALGRAGREWYEREVVETTLDLYRRYIEHGRPAHQVA